MRGATTTTAKEREHHGRGLNICVASSFAMFALIAVVVVVFVEVATSLPVF